MTTYESTGPWQRSSRPIDFGWEGFQNRIRKLLGRPQSMMTVFTMRLEQPSTLQPGESVSLPIKLDL